MATLASHGTLIANETSTVTLGKLGGVEVMNRTGTDEIWFTVGTVANPPAAPEVEGTDCYVVPAGITSYVLPFPEDAPATGPIEVQLTSGSAQAFSVVAIGGAQT